ncbi:hypothetical protein V6N11_017843 [Hibiscus sabdariffa]|uniref:Uncharacterized protein n=1 Tax=Hibiscus sabdariffa TaxID=183260 RepID=A0ABR2T5M8_9ROSI
MEGLQRCEVSMMREFGGTGLRMGDEGRWRRKAVVFKDTNSRMESMVDISYRLQKECLACKEKTLAIVPATHRATRGVIRWLCPPPGWYKLNSNGAMARTSGEVT